MSPTQDHETRVQPLSGQRCRDNPDLAAVLLSRCRGVDVPHYEQAVLHSVDVGHTVPVERRADAVVGLVDPTVMEKKADHGATEMVIVVEVQLKPATDKVARWAQYLGMVAGTEQCPVALLVICPHQVTADVFDTWFELGPGYRIHPQVIGPDRLPPIVSAEEVVRAAELALLAAAAHPGAPGAIKALAEGFDTLAQATAAKYTEYTLALLDGEARAEMEGIIAMGAVHYRSEFTDRFREAGIEEGILVARRQDLLRGLWHRGVPVGTAERVRIDECADPDVMDQWFERAWSVTSAAELFTD